MIPRSADWKNALADAFRQPEELLAALELPPSLIERLDPSSQFTLRVPRGFVARMRKGDAEDPLLRQVLPQAVERNPADGFDEDPVHDLSASVSPGLLRKYQGRALLVTTGACAVHCRYCFRRHFPYADENPMANQWQEAVQCIAEDDTISEVVLSGGDPLVLDDERLETLAQRLAAIPHVRRLRIHTRLPVVLPERVTAALTAWLTGTRLQPIMVVHANHPGELDGTVRDALQRLHQSGVALFNQAVLLKGINDSTDVLCALSEALFEARVQPYYLHLLDRVQGAAHFEVAETRAQELMRELRIRLPGYLVPRLVRETPGEPFKVPAA